MTDIGLRLQPGNYRLQFADFLDRLAAARVSVEEWQSFVVTHYPDEFLEEMRRCTVRLRGGHLPLAPDSDEGRQLLRAWAIAVRSAVGEDAEPTAPADGGAGGLFER
jgi:hypothetical protein